MHKYDDGTLGEHVRIYEREIEVENHPAEN